ncbi:MAG: hypothetical protein AAGC47_10230 [Bacteroidota bacterium]
MYNQHKQLRIWIFLGLILPFSLCAQETKVPGPIANFLCDIETTEPKQVDSKNFEGIDQFGQFEGAWKMTSHALHQGQWVSGWPAYWAWKYSVGGQVIQDYFYQSKDDFPPVVNKDFDTHGFNLRVYDPESDSWNITWIANSGGESRMIGEFRDGIIFMKSTAEEDKDWRILFYDISEDSFKWRQEFLQEDGTWEHQHYLTGERIEGI